MDKILKTIETAKKANFKYAFIADPTFKELDQLKNNYQVERGWNNIYLTGCSTMAFGYLVKL